MHVTRLSATGVQLVVVGAQCLQQTFPQVCALSHDVASGDINAIASCLQADKHGHGWLSDAELHTFCQAAVPDASPAQLRYLRVMLDLHGAGHVPFRDVQCLANVCRNTGLAFPVKSTLDATDILTRVSVYLFDTRLTLAQFLRRFDKRKLERLDRSDVAAIVRVVLRSASRAQAARLVLDAFARFDEDSDGYISYEEFRCAVELGQPQVTALEQQCAAAGALAGVGARADARGEALESSLKRLEGEHAALRHVEAGGSRSSTLMQQLSSLTGGRSRRLGMGSAKAAAQHVDCAALLALRGSLCAELDTCKEFEVAFARRINAEYGAEDPPAAQQVGATDAAAAAPRRAGARGAPQLATADVAAERARKARERSESPARGPRSAPQGSTKTGRVRARRVSAGNQGQARVGLCACVVAMDESNVAPWVAPRQAKQIPALAQPSTLLASTEARRNYMVSMIDHAGNVCAQAHTAASRTGEYPVNGPGSLHPLDTAWERRRKKYVQQGGGRETTLVFDRHAARHARVKQRQRPATAGPMRIGTTDHSEERARRMHWAHSAGTAAPGPPQSGAAQIRDNGHLSAWSAQERVSEAAQLVEDGHTQPSGTEALEGVASSSLAARRTLVSASNDPDAPGATHAELLHGLRRLHV